MNAPKFFAPTNDFVFKKIFGDERNIDILADFLQAILELPPDEYEHIKLVDPHAKRDHEKDKLGILDVQARTKTGQLIDIEIQVSDTPFMRERIVFYLSKLITGQIEKGMGYKSIKRAICIIITDYVLAPETEECCDQFFLYSELTKTRFSDIVEIDTLELPKIPTGRNSEKLRQWIEFLKGKNMEDFEMLTQENPAINKAVGVLMELNASQRRRMLAESRLKARWDEQARLEGATERGYTSGIEKGKEEGLILGEKKGIQIGKAQMCLEMGIPVADIAAKTGLSAEEIARI
jgi:predicted transposase/invertase (TIGR01784 family)